MVINDSAQVETSIGVSRSWEETERGDEMGRRKLISGRAHRSWLRGITGSSL